jgi:hypothetical protein
MSTSDHPSPEIIQTIRLGNEPTKSGIETFLEPNRVIGDEREISLLTDIHRLDLALTKPFTLASRAYEGPKYFSKEYKVAASGLKSLIQLLRELDEYRYGYLATRNSYDSAPPIAQEAVTALKDSDSWLADKVRGRIDGIRALAEICDRQCHLLSQLEYRELCGEIEGRRVAPNQLEWEAQFFELAIKLRDSASKLAVQMDRRNRHRAYVHSVVAKAAAKQEQLAAMRESAKGASSAALPNKVLQFRVGANVAKAFVG